MRMWSLALPLVLIAALPHSASACAVCMGDSGSPLTAGMNMGILSLLAITGGVLSSFVAFFLHLRRMAKRPTELQPANPRSGGIRE